MEKPSKFRSFIAIDLPKSLIDYISIIIQKLKSSDDFKKVHCRWVKPNNIHITVKFLGNISEEQHKKITDSLNKLLLDCEPFYLIVNKILPFPVAKPRMVILDIEPNPQLDRLATIIEIETEKHGIPQEHRPFKPHITLARIESNPFPKIENSEFTITKFDVTEIKLYKSEPSPSGSKYTQLTSFSLIKK